MTATTEADLYHSLRVNQTLLVRQPEGRPVGDVEAVVGRVGVGVSINMDEPHRTILLLSEKQRYHHVSTRNLYKADKMASAITTMTCINILTCLVLTSRL